MRSTEIQMPSLPSERGIYCLKLAGEIIYVGQSVNVGRRVIEHMRNRDFDAVEFLLPDDPDCNLREIEAELITAIRPSLNQKLPSGSRWVCWKTIKKRFPWTDKRRVNKAVASGAIRTMMFGGALRFHVDDVLRAESGYAP